ncbi:DUF4129 domain-containing protein [Jannaschia sp. R86511]|uniref:DUF4129 domain-containing protein n=1 Tax=Jannaschia sp. R86511 TaxID=3093853 RepID=UPI0036D265B1
MGRVAGVAGVAALGLAAVVLSVLLGPPAFAPDSLLDRFRPYGDVEPAPEQVAPAEEAVQQVDVPEPVLGVPAEVVLVMVAVVVGTALLARSLLRAEPGEAAVEEPGLPPEDEPAAGPDVDLPAVRDAVHRGVQDLDRAGPGEAGDVVVACWLRLEAAAGDVGSGRRPADSPTDFATRLRLAAPGLDGEALLRLRSVYSRVRFSAAGPGGASVADAAAARAALGRLLASLGSDDLATRTTDAAADGVLRSGPARAQDGPTR